MGTLKVLILVMILGCFEPIADGLGVNWGTLASHPLPSKAVVQLLKDNGIKKVKLFDADSGPMNALAGSGLEVMVAIPNNLLGVMTDYAMAKKWVNRNVTGYNFNGGVNIKYVAVGNEPFLSSYNGSFLNVTLPALQNIQKALNEAGVGSTIKATVPLNADVYEGDVPSAGKFRTDISDLMTQIVTFLNQSGAPFMVNIYPFLSLYDSATFPFEYAFFDNNGSTVTDNGIVYTNVFDANFDTLVSALKTINFGSMEIIVGEVGWPTDGDINAKAANAQRFYAGLMKKLAANTGTPLRSNQYIEMYLFGLIDEDAKTVAPGNFERHWGVLKYDGQPKFNMDLTGQGRSVTLVPAKGVEYQPKTWCLLNPKAQNNMTALTNNINYACTYADCTSLGYGSTCNGLDSSGNASYAFNAYFQVQSQIDGSCNFDGLATVTTQDPSTNGCNFTIQIVLDDSFGLRVTVPVQVVLLHVLVSVFLVMVW
ncbi:glucan endo-1,3-beta-glucosidase 8-like [Carex rostrata]